MLSPVPVALFYFFFMDLYVSGLTSGAVSAATDLGIAVCYGFGELLLRLNTRGFQRFSQAREFEAH